MRIIFYLLTFLMLSTVSLANHADKMVDKGVKLYQSKHYIEALKVLEEGLFDNSLHDHNVPRAHYYRGLTYIALGRTKKSPHEEPYLLGFYDLVKARIKDTEIKEWSGIASEKLATLKPSLVKRAMFLFKAKDLSRSRSYFEALTIMLPNEYVYYDYVGQCDLMKGDTSKALFSFEKAQQNALNFSNEEVDFSMGYSFYRTAKLFGLSLSNPQKGIEVIKKARIYVENENDELEKTTLKISNDTYNKLLKDKKELSSLLDRLELELSTRGGDSYNSTIKGYEKALEKNADDIPVLIAYATFVEIENTQKAIELYKKVIDIDPQNFSAFYGIGALYVEQGSEYMNKAREANENEKITAFNSMGKKYYGFALPYFVKAYKLNPKEGVLLQTILQLSKAVGDEETYQKYNEINK